MADFSPSTLRRLFADVAWRGSLSAINVSVTAASNDLTGNGTSPIALLDLDRRAVFTHPDATDNDIALVTLRARHQSTPGRHFEGVAYFRNGRIGTFNGDALDDDDDDGEEDLGFDAVNNISRTRTRSAGASGQMTHAALVLGRSNHLIVGAGWDVAAIEFDFASEWATLTPVRGTIGSGLFDDNAFVDLHSRATTGSAFVTDTWALTPALAVSASARFNWTHLRLRDQIGTALTGNHTFGRVNPAAGLTYQLSDSLNVFGGYSQSSRVPTPVELTCADPDDPCRLPNAFVADPPLEQVVARTWEGGVRAGSGPVRGTVTAFSTAATDDIIFVSSGTLRGEGHFENVARTTRRGLETSVALDTARVSIFAAYTRQAARFGTDFVAASRNHPDAVDRETFVASGSRLPGVPAHSGKAGADVRMTSRLSVGGFLRAQSGQFLRGDEANLLQPLPGFTVISAHARHRLTERLVIVGQLQNVLNARYYTFGVLGEDELIDPDRDDPRFYSPGAPRAGWIGVEVTF
jgi:iron complex outermembrane recepter protein